MKPGKVPHAAREPRVGHPCSKALDKVNHYILFKKLADCNVPEVFVKLLANWYSSQLLCVRQGITYSKFFTVSNGVRQGSILSPFLFAVYMNQLS